MDAPKAMTAPVRYMLTGNAMAGTPAKVSAGISIALAGWYAHTATIVTAGHWPPLLRRREGHVERVGEQKKGLVLSVDDEQTYQTYVQQLEPGDALVLFTDGVIDAINQREESYGEGRLRMRLAECCGSSLESGQCLLEDIQAFVGSAEQQDDICLVYFNREAPAEEFARKIPEGDRGPSEGPSGAARVDPAPAQSPPASANQSIPSRRS